MPPKEDKMKKILNICVCLTVLAMASCSSSTEKESYDKSIMPEGYDPNASASNSPQTDTTVSMPNNATVPSDNGQPSTQVNTVIPQQGNAVTPQQMISNLGQGSAPAKTFAAKGMNPAHGEPGHDCAIPVGSPLGSNPAAQTPTVNAAPVITTSPAPTVATPAGMNPPHGEPGHRCDISVGQPLNSKPVANIPGTNNK